MKMDILLESLYKYYKEEENITKLLEVIEVNNKISLRIIDWFVTNYSKNNRVRYNHNGVEVSVYTDYKNQLRAFSKKMFDPFCRRKREEIEGIGTTTIGQMNFFKWAIEKGVLNYIFSNAKEIECSMNYSNSIKNKKITLEDDSSVIKLQNTAGFSRETGNEYIVKFN